MRHMKIKLIRQAGTSTIEATVAGRTHRYVRDEIVDIMDLRWSRKLRCGVEDMTDAQVMEFAKDLAEECGFEPAPRSE